jgi:arsenite methyltransferase
MSTAANNTIDVQDLRSKVQSMYTQVALQPQAGFHFELGRELALKLGYQANELESVPPEAVESFAGVGYHFDLANIQPGESVLDLGSGSGMDVFIASRKVGSSGAVVGLDMTDAQLGKSEALAKRDGFTNVTYQKGYLEKLPFAGASFDLIISNGVINLCAEKFEVFREMARVLKPGGRFAISDILTEKQLTDNIVCDTALWASCIGGATQQDVFRQYLSDAGFTVSEWRDNPEYHFISRSAQGATRDFGVKSASIAAVKS